MRPNKETAREREAFVTETSDFVFTIKLISKESIEAAGDDVTQDVLIALGISLAAGVYERDRDMREWKEPAVTAQPEHHVGTNALGVRVHAGRGQRLIETISREAEQSRATVVRDMLTKGLEALDASTRNAPADEVTKNVRGTA